MIYSNRAISCFNEHCILFFNAAPSHGYCTWALTHKTQLYTLCDEQNNYRLLLDIFWHLHNPWSPGENFIWIIFYHMVRYQLLRCSSAVPSSVIFWAAVLIFVWNLEQYTCSYIASASSVFSISAFQLRCFVVLRYSRISIIRASIIWIRTEHWLFYKGIASQVYVLLQYFVFYSTE